VQTLGFEQSNFSDPSYKMTVFPHLLVVACTAALLLLGCQKAMRTEDPQLKPIQQMLDEQLPPGTTEATVNEFLSTRGYTSEPSGKQGTIVTTIRHIDQERLKPVTAKITFYFDTNGKLTGYELQRTLNQPIPQ
jgi:hypothetical protein